MGKYRLASSSGPVLAASHRLARRVSGRAGCDRARLFSIHWYSLTLARPPLLLIHLRASLARGSDGFLSFVGLDDERVHRRQRGELTLGRGIGVGRLGYGGMIHHAEVYPIPWGMGYRICLVMKRVLHSL